MDFISTETTLISRDECKEASWELLDNDEFPFTLSLWILFEILNLKKQKKTH